MIIKTTKKTRRQKRHFRLRSKIQGTSQCPRLSVFKSNKHVYVQIIDDTTGKTLISASTLQPAVKSKLKSTWTTDAAKIVGEVVAKAAIDKGVNKVVFDRGGNSYHGKILALADIARSSGLKF